MIIIGPGAVGKTSLLHRYIENKFQESYKATIGVDFMSKIVELKEDIAVKLTIWDIGGQERYNFLHESFYEKANGALIVFDLSRPNTFDDVELWIKEVAKYAGENVPYLLIGNKLDLVKDVGETVARDKVKEFNSRKNCIYIETSAKTGDNVEESFIKLSNLMIEVFSYLE